MGLDWLRIATPILCLSLEHDVSWVKLKVLVDLESLLDLLAVHDICPPPHLLLVDICTLVFQLHFILTLVNSRGEVPFKLFHPRVFDLFILNQYVQRLTLLNLFEATCI